MAKQPKVARDTYLSDDELELLVPPYEIQLAIVLFSQAFNTFAALLERTARPAGITMSQFVALSSLVVTGQPMTPTEISRLLPLETHSVSALLDRLQERKLIRRRRSTKDRRSVKVTLTAEGVQLVRDIAPAMRSAMMGAFDPLSSRELRMLNRTVRKICNASVFWLGANPDNIETTRERLVPKYQSVRTSTGSHGKGTRASHLPFD